MTNCATRESRGSTLEKEFISCINLSKGFSFISFWTLKRDRKRIAASGHLFRQTQTGDMRCCMVPLLFTVLLAFIIDFAAGGGKLSIKLLHFENPNGKLPNGNCCDGYKSGSTTTCAGCEYYFIICISKPTGKPCSLKKIWTEELAFRNYYVFPTSFDTMPDYDTIQNPTLIDFNKWEGRLSLNVSTFDEDEGNDEMSHHKNDVVSVMEQQNISVSAQVKAHAVNKKIILFGKPRGGKIPKITLEVSVTCDDNFLVPSCRERCIDTDGPTGHYKCNYINGTRECLTGWYGPNCLKPKLSCTPRDDNLGHYSCDPSTGEKICLQGWMDPSTDCIKAIIVTSSKPQENAVLSTSMISSTQSLEKSTAVFSTKYVTPHQSTTSLTFPTVISASPTEQTSTIFKQKFRVFLQGNGKEVRNSSMEIAEREICNALRRIYFNANITCLFSDSEMQSGKDASSKIEKPSVKFERVNCTIKGITEFAIDVIVIDKKSNLNGGRKSVEDAIWAANSNIRKRTSFGIAKVTSEAIKIESSVQVPCSSTYACSSPIFAASSIVLDIGRASDKKATFDITRFSGFLAAILALMLIVLGMVVAVIRKKREVKNKTVHPFKMDSSFDDDSNAIFSSRNTLKSVQSTRETSRREQMDPSTIFLTPMEREAGKTQRYSAMSHRSNERETRFDETEAENRPRYSSQDIFLQSQREYVTKKSIAL